MQYQDSLPLRQIVKRQTFVPLLQDTLQALQNPLCSPESHQCKNVAYTIKNCAFFRNHLPAHIDLNKFAELAKFYVHYETHETGSILHHGRDEVNKFYIILDGAAVKMRSKTVSIDFDLKDSLDTKLSLNYPRSNPENQYPSVFSKDCLETQKESQEIRPSVGYFLKPRLMLPLQQLEGQSSEPQTPKSPTATTANNSRAGAQNRLFTPEVGNHQQKTSLIFDEIKTEEEDGEGKANPARKAIFKIFNPTTSSPKGLKKMTSVHVNAREVQEGAEKKKTHQRKSGFGSSLLKIDDDHCEPTTTTVTPKNSDTGSPRKSERKSTTNFAKIQTFEAGDYFGEVFSSPYKQRENCTIITSSDVMHALTLDRESYFAIIRELNAYKKEKLEIFTNLFPSFDVQLVDEFSTHFTKKTFGMDEVVYSEKESSQNFYLLRAGGVKLLKDFQTGNAEPTSPSSSSMTSSKKEISVVSIVKNQVFGEEVLVTKPFRQYTAVSNSPNTVAYMMDSSTIERIKFKFGQLFEVLKTQAEEKLVWRCQKALEIFESQTHSRSSCSSLLTYTPKNCKTTKQSLSWADVNTPQKSKPVFHASSFQQFVERSPTLPKIDTKKDLEECQTEVESGRLEKYKNAFSRAYIAPKLTVLQNHRKAASFKSNKNLTVKMNDPFEFNIRKELYCNSKKFYQGESSSQSPTDKKIQRAQVKAKTMIPIHQSSPKIMVTPIQARNTSTFGTVSAFRDKLPQMIHLNKSPKSPSTNSKIFNLDLATLAQNKSDTLNILSITNRSKSAQKILPEPIKV